MRIWAAIIFLTVAGAAFGQLAKPVQFREETFDFGMITEEAGPALHEFLFTNNTGRPVKVLSVQASCGCTTPSWSKEPVAPGKTGFIQASYNPKGRPGYFNKSLTVTTDLDPTPIILSIKGQVQVQGVAASSTEFQVANGAWKLKTASFNLGKVFMQDESASRDFPFVNAGQKPVTYTGKFVGPKYITVDVKPKTLQPGERGSVRIVYNGKLKNTYGFQTDNVEILTDDELNPTKSFTVYATLEDDFSNIKPEDLQKAPQLKLQNTSVDIGRIRPNQTAVQEVSMSNTGKKELDIRALQGNCSCITASSPKNTLKPGESTMLKIEFSPGDRKGNSTKAITLYSNDPLNPVQRVTLTAYIE
ncbi:DUF1573 domain-containing protein [Chryseolinea sp. T2]|uniref:DUF1573 domain-containing protein n=1 Tax=Chryseolinea sp. T2 TaxID=3129255 RepID=UPI0030787DEF